MKPNFWPHPIHEWLGIALIAMFVYHFLLHWQWIVTVITRITQKLPTADRIKSLVDLLLYIAMVIVIASGMWISETAMQQLGIVIQPSSFWRWLHHASAEWTLWLTGLHLALSWPWIAINTKHYVWQPLISKWRPRAVVRQGYTAEVAE